MSCATTGNLNGSGAKIFPDEGSLRGVKKRSDIGCPCSLGVQHPFGELTREVLNDCSESFQTNLIMKHAKLTIGL